MGSAGRAELGALEGRIRGLIESVCAPASSRPMGHAMRAAGGSEGGRQDTDAPGRPPVAAVTVAPGGGAGGRLGMGGERDQDKEREGAKDVRGGKDAKAAAVGADGRQLSRRGAPVAPPPRPVRG